SMAENHPVGFQWVVAAREKGARVVHVDPRFSRTSAMADAWVPLRAGTDIVFLGALIRHTIESGRVFREYVVPYTNAATIVRDDFRDTEDLAGLFSGWDEANRRYSPESWMYAGAPTKGKGGGTPGHEPESGGHGKDRSGESQEITDPRRDPTL